MNGRKILAVGLLISLLTAGCIGSTYPPDIVIDNDRESPVHVRVYANDSAGNVEFQAERHLNASEDAEFDEVLTLKEEYEITLIVNGTRYREPYGHLDDTGIWFEICENDVEAMTLHAD